MITLITNYQHVTYDQSLIKACLTRDQYNWQVIHTWLTCLTCDTWLKLPPDQHVTDMWLTRSCNQHVWHVTVWPGHDWHVTKWHTTDMTRDWLARCIVTREWCNWHMIHTWPTLEWSRLSTSDRHVIKYDTWLTHCWHDQHVTGDSHDWHNQHMIVFDTCLRQDQCFIDIWLTRNWHDWHVTITRDWHVSNMTHTWSTYDHPITWLTQTWPTWCNSMIDMSPTQLTCDWNMTETWPTVWWSDTIDTNGIWSTHGWNVTDA